MKNFYAVLILLLSSFYLFSQDLTVSEIIRKYEDNMKHKTESIEARITTTDNFGTTHRTFQIYSRENGDTLIIIADGPDKGQKILRLENSIFLFYPSAEEVIRLTGSALKENIAGTDFSYEDLSGGGSIEAGYSILYKGMEEINSRSCYVLELNAKKKTQAYQKQTLYVDSTNFTAVKTVVYSASGKALREIISSEVSQVSGKYIPFKTIVTDLLKKNSKTEMTILNASFNENLPENYFSREGLTW